MSIKQLMFQQKNAIRHKAFLLKLANIIKEDIRTIYFYDNRGKFNERLFIKIKKGSKNILKCIEIKKKKRLKAK